jgi:N-formylglutamate deformylase
MVESLFLKEYNGPQEQNKAFCVFFKGINVVEDVLICQKPPRQTAPLVLDSPHSGNLYPEDFRHACPRDWLRETEDSYVDELFGDAPAQGVPLLKALFPRCYIDANRAEDDIDPKLLAEPWPGPANPSERSGMGLGLVRRLFRTNNPQPIYDRLLGAAEIRHRLDNYYHPYHAALKALLDETFSVFGAVWHLNCHSMPSTGWNLTRYPPDIVLGDRDGTSCDAAFTRQAAKILKSMGYRVAVNRPYKGVELVRRYANPGRNRHSLQIELRRSLYMDEQTLRKSAAFAQTRQNMARLVKELAEFTRQSGVDLAAD